jgi:asparaginyl-tRNA synthetase
MTRRHLSELTHCEAELAFISFKNLLEYIEDMMCYVSKKLYENKITMGEYGVMRNY